MKSTMRILDIGRKIWELPNGKKHREDGPAIEGYDGSKEWWVNGKYHREDGPAIEYANGVKSWWLNGSEYTQQEHKLEMRSIKLKQLLG